MLYVVQQQRGRHPHIQAVNHVVRVFAQLIHVKGGRDHYFEVREFSNRPRHALTFTAQHEDDVIFRTKLQLVQRC